MQKWFMGGDAFDEEIRSEFLPTVEQALDTKEGLSWKHGDMHERLAHIIVLDQFPRNLFRGTPKAFAGDSEALRIVKDSLKTPEKISELSHIARVFFYMPLMHSEHLEDQDLLLKSLLPKLENEDPSLKENLKSTVESAKQHRDLISRFNRFPHRNMILGRENTQAEQQYLSDKDATSFGQ